MQTLGHAETVIVGAGIVGSALALHLARMGHRDVLVIERGRLAVPTGSTGHAPGLLGRNASMPALAAMACHTADLLGALPSEAPALKRVGSIEVVRSRSRLRDLERKHEAAVRNGIRAALITAEETVERVPYLEKKVVVGGLFCPDDGVMDVKRGLRAIQAEAAGLGVVFRDATEVTGFAVSDDLVSGVTTRDGLVGCGRAVLATGIWGRELMSGIGVSLPLFPIQHPYVTTAPLPMLAGNADEASHPFVRDVERLFYLREHGDRLGFGWFSHEPVDSDPQPLRTADLPFPRTGLLEALEHDLVPALRDATAETRLNGLLAMTPDGLPLVGRLEDRPNLWVAAALWVTHAGGAALALAELMTGRTPTIDLSAFAPHRFAHVADAANRRASLTLYNDIYSWGDPVLA